MTYANAGFQLIDRQTTRCRTVARTRVTISEQGDGAGPLRPIDKARPTMTATAIIDNLNLSGLKEEFLNHRRIAQDRLKRLQGRLTARIQLFAGQFLAIDYLKPRKSRIETLTIVLKHGMTQNFNVVRCMFALAIKDVIFVKPRQQIGMPFTHLIMRLIEAN